MSQWSFILLHCAFLRFTAFSLRPHSRPLASVKFVAFRAGSESGDVPEPNWSASANSVTFGRGDPNGKQFAPSEADVTTSATGEWYW